MQLTKRKYLVALVLFLVLGLITILTYSIFFNKNKVDNQVLVPDFNQVEEGQDNNNFSEKAGLESMGNPLEEEIPDIKEETNLSFLFFGDMMLDRHVGKIISNRGADHLFTKLIEKDDSFFKNFDIIGANLEGAVTDGGAHYLPDYKYDFAFDPEVLKIIKENYNYNFFTIANNHLTDQGERGIKETRTNLSELDFYFSGCRDGVADDCSLEIITIQDKKVAFLGFSMVYGIPAEAKMYQLARKAASSSDLVIANIHWGVEYAHQFNQTQQNIAHSLIDNGVDIIIGHHPHVVQGMEIYQGKAIFYSLGNFIFDQYFSQATQESLAIEIQVGEKEIYFSLIPLKSNISQVRFATQEEAKTLLTSFVDWSQLNKEEQQGVKEGSFTLNRD